MIQIVIIGTGAQMPAPERALCSVFLACGGVRILFDCGEGTQSAAVKAGAGIMKTDIIALSHYHGDHIFGLPGLLQTMACSDRTKPLYITGPSGLKRRIGPLVKAAEVSSFDICYLDSCGRELSLRDLNSQWPQNAYLRGFGTKHRVPSQGYCFGLRRNPVFLPEKAAALGVPVTLWKKLQQGGNAEFDGKTVVPGQVMGENRKGLSFIYSGDTSPCSMLTSCSSSAELAVLDATYGDNEQRTLAEEHGHMTFRTAAETAAAAGVKQLCLIHYSQMIKDPADHIHNAKEVFDNTVCAYDGMKLELSFEE